MKDTELKQLLREAYKSEPTPKQKAFIRKYKRRELKLSRLLFMQLRYMKLQYMGILLGLLGFFFHSVRSADARQILAMSAFMPFLALLALIGIGSSRRYRMEELEMSTRLSLRMLKALRLVLLGAVGLLCILSAAAALKHFLTCSVPFALLVVGVPYMVTTSACMVLIRRWHAKENIYGCAVIAAGVSFLTMMAANLPMLDWLALRRMECVLLVAAAVFWVMKESYVYLTESEEYQWSLC